MVEDASEDLDYQTPQRTPATQAEGARLAAPEPELALAEDAGEEFYGQFENDTQYNCLGGSLETIDEKSKSDLETIS